MYLINVLYYILYKININKKIKLKINNIKINNIKINNIKIMYYHKLDKNTFNNYSITEFQYSKFIKLKDELNKARQQINDIINKNVDNKYKIQSLFDKISMSLYAFDNLCTKNGILVSKYGAEMVTNTWLKIYELGNIFLSPFLENKIQKRNPKYPKKDDYIFRSLHVVEAPGTFIIALNHLLKTKFSSINWNWTASTYLESTNDENQNNKKTEYFDDTYGIMHYFPNNWYYGANHNGDVTNIENLISFRHFMLNGVGDRDLVDLYTADGGIPITDDCNEYGNIDIINQKLYFGKVLCGFLTLKEGGIMIVKTFDHLEACVVSILYLISCCFKETYVTKPQTSKPANSECYVVGVGYESLNRQQLNDLIEIFDKINIKNQHMSIFKKEDIPRNFVNEIKKWNNYIVVEQINAITKNMKKYNKYYNSLDELTEKYEKKRNQICEVWVHEMKIKKMDDKYKLLNFNKDKDVI